MKANRLARVFLTAFVASGCYVAPERSVLEQFFKYSRLRDRTALADYSTVIFEPLEQGIVTDFTVIDRVPLSRSADGEVTSKDITITAPVKLPTGRVEDETLVVRLERRESRWKITAVRIKS